MWSGQAMVLDRLVGELPAEQCVVIASARVPVGPEPRNATFVLPPEPFEKQWCSPGRRATFSVLARCLVRAWRIARILAREQCTGVIACTGDLIDMPASAIACRALGVTLLAYYFDDYVAQWSWAPAARTRAEACEPFVLRQARHVLVPNERLQEAVARRSGHSPRIIRNPAWTEKVPDAAPRGGANGGPCKIVYTGAVYHVNYDAFRCLIASFDHLGDLKPELHIYTAQDAAQLAQEGIQGPAVSVFAHVSPAVAWEKQCTAAVLFMGFSFAESVSEIVRSSAPGKLGDYLASGVPIVALTPRGSFLAQFLAEHECGAVVDRLDPVALAVAIRKLATDEFHRHGLVTNAVACARREFMAALAVRKLVGALGPVSGAAA
jgi:glycosyltransferase involved in cell wall biosynthesis